MKVFFADTNVFIRFLLQDNIRLAKRSEYYFSWAKKKKIKLVVISETIPEIEYILRKFYRLSREEIEKYLSDLVKTPYFEVERRHIWIEALPLYSEVNVDLVDIFLFLRAKKEEGEVLSFEKDFKKLKRGLK